MVSCSRWVIRATSEEKAKEIAQTDEGEMGLEGDWYCYPITPDKNPAILFSMFEYS